MKFICPFNDIMTRVFSKYSISPSPTWLNYSCSLETSFGSPAVSASNSTSAIVDMLLCYEVEQSPLKVLFGWLKVSYSRQKLFPLLQFFYFLVGDFDLFLFLHFTQNLFTIILYIINY